MLRHGRWFWWVVVGCAVVLVADLTEIGPFAESDRQQQVEVLGDSVERELVRTTTSTTATTVVTTTTLSEAEALELLQGLDQETLDALEEIKGADPAALTTRSR